MTRAVDCPTCQQRIGLADPPEVQENTTLRQEVEELKKVTKMPSFIPDYQCKGGNCGQIHQSSRYTNAPPRRACLGTVPGRGRSLRGWARTRRARSRGRSRDRSPSPRLRSRPQIRRRLQRAASPRSKHREPPAHR